MNSCPLFTKKASKSEIIIITGGEKNISNDKELTQTFNNVLSNAVSDMKIHDTCHYFSDRNTHSLTTIALFFIRIKLDPRLAVLNFFMIFRVYCF